MTFLMIITFEYLAKSHTIKQDLTFQTGIKLPVSVIDNGKPGSRLRTSVAPSCEFIWQLFDTKIIACPAGGAIFHRAKFKFPNPVVS